MTEREELIKEARRVLNSNPDAKDEIKEIISMFDCEVAAGESASNELDIALSELKFINS